MGQMVWPIMQHVTALTERAEIPQPVVGRIAVQMRRRKHDARHPEPRCLHKVGPSSHPSATIPPRRRLPVEPPPVRQAADEGEMWPPTTLALASSALEANAAAQFAPVRRVQRSQLGADRHGLCRLLPQYSINAGPANAEPSCDLGRPEPFLVLELMDHRCINFRLPPLVDAAHLRCGNTFSLAFLS